MKPMKECVRIVVTVLCLFAGQVEAKVLAFDFSSQGMGDASAPVSSFAVGDRINLSLPDGQSSFALEIVSAPPPGIAGQSFVAKDANGTASAVIKLARETLRITVDDFSNRKIYSVRIKDGVVESSVREIAMGGGCDCGTCSGEVAALPVPQEPASGSPKKLRLSTVAESGEPPVVDVLVAFDNGAKAWVENEWDGDTLEECADAAVQRMNMVLANSGLGNTYSYRLAGVTVVDDTASAVDYALGHECYGLDAWARVRAAREICGADIVTALVDLGPTFTGTRGVSYGLTRGYNGRIASFAALAFNACHIRSTFAEYTMVHEVGHNLGAGHSDLNNNYEGRASQYCDYAAGLHFANSTGGLFRTVMGYVDGSDGRRYAPTPYFSSPTLKPVEHDVYLGTPTNDNVRVLGETCSAVSQFRSTGAQVVDLGLTGKAGELVWRTTSPYPWTSVSATDWTNGVSQVLRGGLPNNAAGTSVLVTDVTGPARLFFRHKTAFYYSRTRIAGESYAAQYSHFDVFLDEKHVVSSPDPVEEWELVSLDIPEGTHELTFSFIQQNAVNGASEGAWVGDIALYDTAFVDFVPPSRAWASKTLPHVVTSSAIPANASFAMYADGGYDRDSNPYVQTVDDGSIVAGTVGVMSGTAAGICALSTGFESEQKSRSGDSYLMINAGSAKVAAATMEVFRDNFTYVSGDALMQLDGTAAIGYAVGGNYAVDGSSIPGNIGITVRGDAQAGTVIGGWTVDYGSATVGGSCAILVENLQTNAISVPPYSYSVPDGVDSGYIVGGGWGACTVEGDTSVTFAPQGNESGVCGKTIIGGGYGADSIVYGSSSVTICGGAYSGLIVAGSSGGTVAGGATLEISGGSFQGARLRGGNASGVKTLKFADCIDLSGVTEVAGFDAISIPDGVKITVTDATVLAAFTTKGYVTKESAPPYLVGLDQSVWRTANGGGNLSENWDRAPSSSADVVFVITEDTTITNDIALSAGTVKIQNLGNSEATLSFAGGSLLSASLLHVSSNVVVKAASGLISFSSVTGSGTVSYSGVKPPSNVGWTGSSWTGTVWVNDIAADSNERKDWDPSLYGHAGSRLRFANVNLYFRRIGDSGTVSVSWNVPIEVKGAGLNICDTYGYQTTVIPVLIGDGRFSSSKDSTNGSCINVLDASQFRGTVSFTHQRLVFGSNDVTVGKGGKVVVESGVGLTVPSNVIWTAAGGWTVNGRIDVRGALASSAATAIAGSGEIIYHNGIIPPGTSAWWSNASWNGTLAMEGLDGSDSTKDFQFEKYGNAASRVLLRNCSIYYLKNSNNTPFPGTLVLDGEDALRFGNNGYSKNWNVFGVLEGDGSIAASSSHQQTYVFNTATNFTGAITVNASGGSGRRIVFGVVSESSDLPSQSATITVKPGATASIGGGVTWFAHHGVEVGGTLLVKGANAMLDCNSSAAIGLKLDDGATLRFEAADALLAFAKAPTFASGTNYIAFASGISPTNGMVLVRWPDGSSPVGVFAFADSALSERFVLNKTATGLVVGNAPLPETVAASITVLNGEWVESSFACELPTSWATNYYPALDTPSAVAAKYDETAANGAKVWQCYMLGLDPTNAASRVSLAMTVVGNEIRFSVEGLGETHALDGINVYWYMKTATNLVTDATFRTTRNSASGLSPTFAGHPMPDTPTANATQPSDTLFYKIAVSFVAEDNESD